MDEDWKRKMEERGNEAEDSAKHKLVYLNLGEVLEGEYWHGFVLGGMIVLLATALWIMGDRFK